MIRFRQKSFSEYDAMRSLYVELLRQSDNRKFKVIDTSTLIPILKGNNVVIEKFVISTSLFGSDKYRMYLKIGAKAKLPDEVRLPGRVYDKRLLDVNFKLSSNIKSSSATGKKSPNSVSSDLGFPGIGITQQVTELLGDAVKYDKKDRSLVLEFKNISDAIRALNILPFGINYQIYLLEQ